MEIQEGKLRHLTRPVEKRHPIRTLFVALALSNLLVGQVYAETWRPYQATREGAVYFYDSDSIEHSPGDLLRVWVKVQNTLYRGEDVKKHADEILSGKREKITGEIVQLLEIDCSKKMFRVINLVVYDENREIKEYFNIPSEWNPIPPGSVTHSLRNQICN